MTGATRILYNGSAVPLAEIPSVSTEAFLQTILDATEHGWRVIAYFGLPDSGDTPLYCLLAESAANRLAALRTVAAGTHVPSIAARCPQLQLFEREIAEQCGLIFDDHPWFKPVRFHRSYVAGRDAWNRPADQPLRVGVMDFSRWRVMRCMRSLSGRCMPGSSNRATSVFSVMVKRFFILRSRWDSSIAG